jgi:hypothetical protein
LISLKNHRVLISLRKDRAVLLVCTGIALLFWFFVKLSKPYVANWDFKLDINAPEGEAFLSLPPDKVNARVQGRGWDLMYFSLFKARQPLKFELDTGPAITINGRMLRERLSLQMVNRNIEVLDVNYDYISLTCEPEVSQTLPLNLAYEIAFLPGYSQNGTPTLKPDSVILTGPESLVQEVSYWDTDSLKIEGLREDYTGKLTILQPIDPVMKVKPVETEVFIPVEPIVEQSFFAKVVIKNAPDSLIIFPPAVKLTYIAGMSKLYLINPGSFQVFADLQGLDLKSQNNTVPLTVNYENPAIQHVQIDPQSVEFFFELSDSTLFNKAVTTLDSLSQ